MIDRLKLGLILVRFTVNLPITKILGRFRDTSDTRNAITGQWILEMVGDEPSEDSNSNINSLWSSADLRIQFN